MEELLSAAYLTVVLGRYNQLIRADRANLARSIDSVPALGVR